MLQSIVVVLIVILTTAQCQNSKNSYVCEIINLNKCPGYKLTITGHPKPMAKLITSCNLTSNKLCVNQCNINDSCVMSVWSNHAKICRLYSSRDYMSIQNADSISVWKCCNSNSSYQPTGNNRCPGFWTKRFNYKFSNKMLSLPLKSLKVWGQASCMELCLQTPSCGAINVLDIKQSSNNKRDCELILQFPVDKLVYRRNLHWTAFYWHCSPNYKLPKPSNKCFSRKGHSAGFWRISNQSIPLPKYGFKIVINFYTNQYEDCLESCQLHTDCQRALYSKKGSKCILVATNNSICGELYIDNDCNISLYTYYVYTWIFCSSSSSDSVVKPIPTFQVGQCRKLASNQNVWIIAVKCGRIVGNWTNAANCHDIDSHTKPVIAYDIVYHCQTTQSFRIVKILDSNGTEQWGQGQWRTLDWLMVSSGYENFVLINVTEANFPLANDCDIYDAYPYEEEVLKNFQIFPRDSYLPLPSPSLDKRFSKTPTKYVIVTATAHPACSCYTEISCSDQIRRLENSYAFPYNFLVSDGGQIYAAKGFKFEDQADTASYNRLSISVAFLGYYNKRTTTAIAMTRFKQLLKHAVRIGKLVPNYTILIHDDISEKISEAVELYRTVALLSGFHGHRVESCEVVRLNVLIVSAVSCLLVAGVVLLLVNQVLYPLVHRPHCRQLAISNIVQACFVTPSTFQRLENNTDNLYTLEALHCHRCVFSIFTSNFFWIEDKQPTFLFQSKTRSYCPCFAVVRAQINLCRFQSQFLQLNTLLSVQERCPVGCRIEFVIQDQVAGPPATATTVEAQNFHGINVLFCHFVNSISTQKLINKIISQKCICYSFTIQKYEPKSRKFQITSSLGECKKSTQILKSSPSQRTQDLRRKLANQYCRAFDTSKCEYYFI